MRFSSQLSLLLLICVIVACATSPLGRRQLILMPSDQLAAMGEKSFSKIQNEVETASNEEYQQLADCVAKRVLSALDQPVDYEEWRVVVFDNDAVNAFAVPGNNIGIYVGLIESSENIDQFAAVVAHEVAHLIARHGNERISQQLAAQLGLSLGDLALDQFDVDPQTQRIVLGGMGLGTQFGILLPYSRKHEREADLVGLKLMARAGFRPQGALEFWKVMSENSEANPPEFLSTHPSHGSRIKSIRKHLPEAQNIYQESLNEKNFQLCPSV